MTIVFEFICGKGDLDHLKRHISVVPTFVFQGQISKHQEIYTLMDGPCLKDHCFCTDKVFSMHRRLMICNTNGHQLRPECTGGHVGEHKLTDVSGGGSIQEITHAEALLCVGENNAAPVV